MLFDIDFSPIVQNTVTGKQIAFDANVICKLKRELLMKAYERDVIVVPLEKTHFQFHPFSNELLFYYNNKDNTTRGVSVQVPA